MHIWGQVEVPLISLWTYSRLESYRVANAPDHTCNQDHPLSVSQHELWRQLWKGTRQDPWSSCCFFQISAIYVQYYGLRKNWSLADLDNEQTYALHCTRDRNKQSGRVYLLHECYSSGRLELVLCLSIACWTDHLQPLQPHSVFCTFTQRHVFATAVASMPGLPCVQEIRYRDGVQQPHSKQCSSTTAHRVLTIATCFMMLFSEHFLSVIYFYFLMLFPGLLVWFSARRINSFVGLHSALVDEPLSRYLLIRLQVHSSGSQYFSWFWQEWCC